MIITYKAIIKIIIKIIKYLMSFNITDYIICVLLVVAPIDIVVRLFGINISLLLSIILYFLLIIYNITKIKFHVTNILSFTYLIIILLFMQNYTEVWFKLFSIINCLILFNLLTISRFSNREYNFFLWSAAISSLFCGLFLLFNGNFSLAKQIDRVYLSINNVTIDPNTAASNFCLCFSSLINLIINSKNRISNTFLLSFFIILLMQILVFGSRGAILGMISILLTFILLNKSKLYSLYKYIYTIFFVFISIIFVFFTIYSIFPNFIDRYDGNKIIKSKGSGRLEIWKETIQNYKNNFSIKQIFFGTGFGTFNTVHPHKRAAHNIYLNMWIETGILGSVLFLVFLISNLVIGYKKSNYVGIASLIGMCICGLFLELQSHRVFWLSMWFCNWYRNKEIQSSSGELS